MNNLDYCEEELRERDRLIKYRTLYQVVNRHHKNAADLVDYIMDNYDYERMTPTEVLVLCDDLHICQQCGEVTESDMMHDGEWDDDICEWCWGNGR